MYLFEQFLSIDKDTIIKPHIGTLSLKEWEPTLLEMYKTISFFDLYYNQIDLNTQEKIQDLASNFLDLINQLIDQNDHNFINNREEYINKITIIYNQLKLYTPYFVSIAVIESKLLDKEDKIKEIDLKIETLEQKTNNSLKKINEESKKIILVANKKAEEIVLSARNVSQKVSVTEAQNQFKNAIKNNKINIWIWGSISFIVLFSFIWFLEFLFRIKVNHKILGEVIYFSVIRLTVIGFFLTALTFCLKLLKSYLHLKEVNQHRMRISNSMAAFVESASSQEQRDIILSKLIESVSDFGNSGMIGKDEESNSKVSIDNITRSISAFKNASELK